MAPRQRLDGFSITSLSQVMPLACRVQCEQWWWVDRTGDTVKQSQRLVMSPTVIKACLLTRSKMFRQHLKCSLTAPRRVGTSFGYFFGPFYSASCLSLPVDLLAPWPSAAVIPRRRSTAVQFQSVERRVQRNLEGLANVRLDEPTVVRQRWLFFLRCPETLSFPMKTRIFFFQSLGWFRMRPKHQK